MFVPIYNSYWSCYVHGCSLLCSSHLQQLLIMLCSRFQPHQHRVIVFVPSTTVTDHVMFTVVASLCSSHLHQLLIMLCSRFHPHCVRSIYNSYRSCCVHGASLIVFVPSTTVTDRVMFTVVASLCSSHLQQLLIVLCSRL